MTARALSAWLLVALLERLDVAEHLVLEAEQEQPRPRAHHRVGRHQLRMRKAIVDVLVDDVRLVQDQVALDQHRHLVVRVHHRQVFGLVVQIDVDDLEIHALFVQHDAAALAEGTGGAGIEGHHSEALAVFSDVLPVFLSSAQTTSTNRMPSSIST